jgi:hypothetical protein
MHIGIVNAVDTQHVGRVNNRPAAQIGHEFAFGIERFQPTVDERRRVHRRYEIDRLPIEAAELSLGKLLEAIEPVLFDFADRKPTKDKLRTAAMTLDSAAGAPVALFVSFTLAPQCASARTDQQPRESVGGRVCRPLRDFFRSTAGGWAGRSNG